MPLVQRGGRDRLHPPPLEVGRPVRAVRHAVRRRRGIRRGLQATHLLVIPSNRSEPRHGIYEEAPGRLRQVRLARRGVQGDRATRRYPVGSRSIPSTISAPHALPRTRGVRRRWSASSRSAWPRHHMELLSCRKQASVQSATLHHVRFLILFDSPGYLHLLVVGAIFIKMSLHSASISRKVFFAPHGGVAQLGERLTGSQEVRGSIPLVSTSCNLDPRYSGGLFLAVARSHSTVRKYFQKDACILFEHRVIILLAEKQRAIGSGVEHILHTDGVTSSNLVSPTIES